MDVHNMEIRGNIISLVLALLAAPLLAGVVNKTKAFFAGRKGAPILQTYYDLFKLLNKDSVTSRATSAVFRMAPVIVLGTTLAAIFLLPFASSLSSLGFTGDFVLIFYFLGVGKFFLILSAMDTASSFEGMGASREAFFSALAEPVVFICMLAILRSNHTTSLINALAFTGDKTWVVTMLVALPMFLVALAENSRIPFDDPNTHLELTMIHEVMILDNSGVDLGIMEYAASLKLWFFILLFSKIIIPFNGLSPLSDCGLTVLLMLASAVAVGVCESVMARCRLRKIPQLMYSAAVIAAIAFILSINNLPGLR